MARDVVAAGGKADIVAVGCRHLLELHTRYVGVCVEPQGSGQSGDTEPRWWFTNVRTEQGQVGYPGAVVQRSEGVV